MAEKRKTKTDYTIVLDIDQCLCNSIIGEDGNAKMIEILSPKNVSHRLSFFKSTYTEDSGDWIFWD